MITIDEIMRYPPKALASLPTLAQGQAADLKVESKWYDEPIRYWLNRVGPEDGAEFPVEVEAFDGHKWIHIGGYGSFDDE